MNKRGYASMTALLPVIEGMPATGMRHRALAEKLGLAAVTGWVRLAGT